MVRTSSHDTRIDLAENREGGTYVWEGGSMTTVTIDRWYRSDVDVDVAAFLASHQAGHMARPPQHLLARLLSGNS